MNAFLSPSVTYVPPEKEWILKVRSTDGFREAILDAVRLWKLHALRRGDDAEVIDLSYFVRSSLQQDIDLAFKEYGGRPKTEAEWKVIENALKPSQQTIDAAAQKPTQKKR